MKQITLVCEGKFGIGRASVAVEKCEDSDSRYNVAIEQLQRFGGMVVDSGDDGLEFAICDDHYTFEELWNALAIYWKEISGEVIDVDWQAKIMNNREVLVDLY